MDIELRLPVARALNPVTGGNWEGIGVEARRADAGNRRLAFRTTGGPRDDRRRPDRATSKPHGGQATPRANAHLILGSSGISDGKRRHIREGGSAEFNERNHVPQARSRGFRASSLRGYFLL
jgi:hypothetical protein